MSVSHIVFILLIVDLVDYSIKILKKIKNSVNYIINNEVKVLEE